MEKVTLDGKEIDLTTASDEVRAQVTNITFVDQELLQRNNELQICETAKIGYLRALKREIQSLGHHG